MSNADTVKRYREVIAELEELNDKITKEIERREAETLDIDANSAPEVSLPVKLCGQIH